MKKTITLFLFYFCLFTHSTKCFCEYSIDMPWDHVDHEQNSADDSKATAIPDLKTVYHYHSDGYLTAIEDYCDQELCRVEKLIWHKDQSVSNPLLIGKIWEDGYGIIQKRQFFEYNASGLLSEIISDNGTSADPTDLSKVFERCIITLSYNQKGSEWPKPYLLEEKFFDVNTESMKCTKIIYNNYDAQGQLSSQLLCDGSGTPIQERTPNDFFEDNAWTNPSENIAQETNAHATVFNALSNTFGEFISSIWPTNAKSENSSAQTKSIYFPSLANLSYPKYMQREWEQIAAEFFGQNFLQFAGYYRDPAMYGTHNPGHEIADKVRITLINGILNIKTDLQNTAHQISITHGEASVHYVFRPTEGWSKDILNSFIVKMGHLSPSAYLLSQTWKKLIQEMGGTKEGGIIIHYAHSIGAMDTYAAKNLLTPEEQQMIHVITFGSPSIIPSQAGFASVVNYISLRDGVCLLDPVSYIKALLQSHENVHFLGSLWGIPLIDHTLDAESYGSIIKKLGEQFTSLYGRP